MTDNHFSMKPTANGHKFPIFFTSAENLFLAHFFSKCYNSKTDKDISMKPTANGHKFPKFSTTGSRAKISESTFELF